MKAQLPGTVLFFILATFQVVGQFAGNWVAVRYLNCLNENLPCNCLSYQMHRQSSLDYHLSDTTSFGPHYRITNYTTDPCISFDVCTVWPAETDSVVRRITISNDTLYSVDPKGNWQDVYIPVADFESFRDSVYRHMIDSLLVNNGHKTLDRILRKDTLIYDCDFQFGLDRVHDMKRVWVLEREKGWLVLYRWKYPPELGRRSKKKVRRRFRIEE